MAAKKKAATQKKVSKPKTRTRKGGGSKLVRTEVVQVRLDPRLRFAADLAARMQRRTLSSFIEWAVHEIVRQERSGNIGNETIDSVANNLWDLNEGKRFWNLAIFFPELLNHDEEIRWDLILKTKEHWMFSKDLKTKIDLQGRFIDTTVLEETYELFQQFLDEEISSGEFYGRLDTAKMKYEENL